MSHCHPPRILDTAKSIPVGTLRWVGPKRLDHPGDDTLHAAHASHPANGVKSTRWTLVLCPLHFLGKATRIRQRSTDGRKRQGHQRCGSDDARCVRLLKCLGLHAQALSWCKYLDNYTQHLYIIYIHTSSWYVCSATPILICWSSWMFIPKKMVVNQWNHHVYGWLKNGNIPKCQLYGIGFITLIVLVIPYFTEWYIFELYIYIPILCGDVLYFFMVKTIPTDGDQHRITMKSMKDPHAPPFLSIFHRISSPFSNLFHSKRPILIQFRLPHDHPGTEAPQQLLRIRKNGELGVPSV